MQVYRVCFKVLFLSNITLNNTLQTCIFNAVLRGGPYRNICKNVYVRLLDDPLRYVYFNHHQFSLLYSNQNSGNPNVICYEATIYSLVNQIQW